MVQSQSTIEVFCSYAPQDKKSLGQLIKHLDPLVREGLISIWNDQKIPLGFDRAREIERHLEATRIILLLVSPDFMASKDHQDVEVKRAMELHIANEAHVIPIIVRPYDAQNAPFAGLECLPRDRQPISKHQNIDEAWANVVRELRQFISNRNSGDIPPPNLPADTTPGGDPPELSQPSNEPPTQHLPDPPIRPKPRIIAMALIIAILVVSTSVTFWFVLHNANQNGNPLPFQSDPHSLFLVVGDAGTILSSHDGKNWTTETSGTPKNLRSVAWSSPLSLFLTVGEAGTILSSHDGKNWTAEASGTSKNLRSVVWSSPLSLFLAVGDAGTILSSHDGKNWTTETSGTPKNLQSLAWSGSLFLVVGEEGTILSSHDGKNWTTEASGSLKNLQG